MAQSILNFKIAATDEKLTPRTGVAIFGEYLKGMGFENLPVGNALGVLQYPYPKLYPSQSL